MLAREVMAREVHSCPKPTGHSPEQLAVGDPAFEQGGLD